MVLGSPEPSWSAEADDAAHGVSSLSIGVDERSLLTPPSEPSSSCDSFVGRNDVRRWQDQARIAQSDARRVYRNSQAQVYATRVGSFAQLQQAVARAIRAARAAREQQDADPLADQRRQVMQTLRGNSAYSDPVYSGAGSSSTAAQASRDRTESAGVARGGSAPSSSRADAELRSGTPNDRGRRSLVVSNVPAAGPGADAEHPDSNSLGEEGAGGEVAMHEDTGIGLERHLFEETEAQGSRGSGVEEEAQGVALSLTMFNPASSRTSDRRNPFVLADQGGEFLAELSDVLSGGSTRRHDQAADDVDSGVTRETGPEVTTGPVADVFFSILGAKCNRAVQARGGKDSELMNPSWRTSMQR